METLLDKVQHIEDTASERVQQADREGKESLSDLLQAEPNVIDDIRSRAQTRAERIVQEKTEATKAEINAMKQERQQSVDAIHAAATQNRPQAVKYILQLFEEEFLNIS